MITHNGTYLWAATHHGMPIYAATMGGKMVITWLLSATKQAIVAAFGSAEGTEVIAKTNDYLNRIATTDPQRALLLAGFINEDPMLVCSLVETSKTRWLVGDGVAYINTGISARKTLNVEIKTSKIVRVSGENLLLGSGVNWSNMYGINWSPNNAKVIPYIYYDGVSTASGLPTEGVFTLNQSGFYIDGVQYLSKSPTTNGSDREIYIFCVNLGNVSYGSKYNNAYTYFTENGADIAHFIPHLRPNREAGMLDIISGTFHPNANTQGTFTIQLTDKEK
jgi:hypothetical protein